MIASQLTSSIHTANTCSLPLSKGSLNQLAIHFTQNKHNPVGFSIHHFFFWSLPVVHELHRSSKSLKKCELIERTTTTYTNWPLQKPLRFCLWLLVSTMKKTLRPQNIQEPPLMSLSEHLRGTWRSQFPWRSSYLNRVGRATLLLYLSYEQIQDH